ncbi:uroporphyrinogen-III C-methyltransferase [Aquariibacter albus]|uniref:uroporphyrinogen-III C-methyltransferase n=1 Tax=Aquariibacter albus TaxID=2759899 RepID=A0A839HTV7_9BURK|nr:uroporphyrinogen-III C-methyltransferase [Aquariibacter albus]MBB1163080.1 uroporphyrinogen-III C-methyltransferase [Aquariibacter albus]
MRPPAPRPLPTVWLVGAGPGDPELLTLRAARLLGEADVVLCDDLVDRRVLALLKPEARVLPVGKRGGCVSTEQAFIHQLMVREARAGRRVVRLKGGDPFVFGRGGEEVDALREAGLDVQVVPGLSAGVAGPAAFGIPVTDRRHARGLVLVTGHAQDGGAGPDWASLAATARASALTLVVYMGVARSAAIAQALIEGGLPADTPAAVVQAAHTEAQRLGVSTLAGLPALIAREGYASPAVLVIGEVLHAAALAREALAEARTDTVARQGHG